MPDLTSGATAIAVMVAVALVTMTSRAIFSRRHGTSRAAGLQRLLDLADLLECDLRTCRHGLEQAHALISPHPDRLAAGEPAAQGAIDAGLRALLQQRLWIRDHGPRAGRRELEQAMQSMTTARQRLQPLLAQLSQTQRDLDHAMREHIRRGPAA